MLVVIVFVGVIVIVIVIVNFIVKKVLVRPSGVEVDRRRRGVAAAGSVRKQCYC